MMEQYRKHLDKSDDSRELEVQTCPSSISKKADNQLALDGRSDASGPDPRRRHASREKGQQHAALDLSSRDNKGRYRQCLMSNSTRALTLGITWTGWQPHCGARKPFLTCAFSGCDDVVPWRRLRDLTESRGQCGTW
jgi:hypothetical protein